ncbi:Hypothetical_protein [Hexamita inflata]|uniref:Hypothetical_protein n=1 Tax=Hexamita inflata TaxID=28002 RepID=A0AA86QUX6_9EUKA|nr:Hypothetical protein HINF_LOCUS45715 [Hexamita inflata]
MNSLQSKRNNNYSSLYAEKSNQNASQIQYDTHNIINSEYKQNINDQSQQSIFTSNLSLNNQLQKDNSMNISNCSEEFESSIQQNESVFKNKLLCLSDQSEIESVVKKSLQTQNDQDKSQTSETQPEQLMQAIHSKQSLNHTSTNSKQHQIKISETESNQDIPKQNKAQLTLQNNNQFNFQLESPKSKEDVSENESIITKNSQNLDQHKSHTAETQPELQLQYSQLLISNQKQNSINKEESEPIMTKLFEFQDLTAEQQKQIRKVLMEMDVSFQLKSSANTK